MERWNATEWSQDHVTQGSHPSWYSSLLGSILIFAKKKNKTNTLAPGKLCLVFQHVFGLHLSIHCSLSSISILVQSLNFKSLLHFGAIEQSKLGWLTVGQIYKSETLGHTVPSLYTHWPPWVKKRSRIKSKKGKKGLEKVHCSPQITLCVFLALLLAWCIIHSRYVISIWWLTNWMNSPHIAYYPCFSIWIHPM